MMRAVATLDETAQVDDIPVIELAGPLHGFPEASTFTLMRVDETGTLCRLRSLEDERLQFLVVPAVTFFPDYAPVVGDDVVTDLGIESADDVLVLLIINAAATLADTTANLRAPLLVNIKTNRAAQVVLDEADLPLAAPLLG
jgi:flagellar assembly factor FliW